MGKKVGAKGVILKARSGRPDDSRKARRKLERQQLKESKLLRRSNEKTI
tara:strand:- start:195 stop:341 length:147 start_codon:yes stop_codon:yes gene_type:complete